jgi:hypothetical protein
MKIDPGDGRPNGNGIYVKEGTGPNPHLGAVYAVVGSSSQIGGLMGLPHPAMITSQNVLGSMILDVDAGRLEARFLDNFGVVRDSFAILKGGVLAVAPQSTPRTLSLAVTGSNPFTHRTRFSGVLPVAGPMRVDLLDASGRRVTTLARGSRPAGRFEIGWDGTDGSGRRVPAGIYFAAIEHAGHTAACRVVRLR